MNHGLLRLAPLALLLMPLQAAAAEASQDSGKVAALMGLGLGIVALYFLMVLFIYAVVIWIAAGIVGLPNASFGTAFKAAFFTYLMAFILGILSALLGSFLGADAKNVLVSLSGLIASTIAIKTAYKAGFVQSLLTSLAAIIVTVVLMFVLIIGLLALTARTQT